MPVRMALAVLEGVEHSLAGILTLDCGTHMRVVVGVDVLDPGLKTTVDFGIVGQATKPLPDGGVKQVPGFEVVIPHAFKCAVERIFPAGFVVAQTGDFVDELMGGEHQQEKGVLVGKKHG
ncbi:hypothetical protein D9M70_547500 [compost metagenome]